ncbi:class I SAM-dependent methyltransferase [Acinetobacter sp. V91_7]|uniref:class I SAM-dependent methyltransferase n=1 Tax=unclassified Acinetobacter TaxID=196816 RepID=UPI00287D9DF9|nr:MULTISPECIES: class I SAM-dependent methyltransferase [unclassified Acinetobacter]MDS7932958.1 class I SAM-dependent methyltransferase [Acinetobacter sp. V91_4B]MDS7962979.1 class I SAM-dependent methyltransferase [Acinetobacter sp. V91_7]MDS8026032.1 class I SAM-dependent methyltransferase [Acinetobacter sp. V91_13]
MKEGQSSRTAEAAAALRANHFKNTVSPVFSDPYAFELTSRSWKKLLSSPLLVKLMNSAVLNRTLGLLTGQVVGRSRYAEDLLDQAIQSNTQQYVLVGAGLDSFVLRESHHYPTLKIFEVDHPDTQAAKQAKLKKLGNIPASVEFVAINFEKESISEALTRSLYERSAPAFFSWLGTTHYLNPQTTLQTLKSIAEFAANASEVVLDYSTDFQELTGIERIGSMGVAQFTHLLKEPLLGQFKPTDLHHAVEQMGFEVVEDLSGEAITERYFSARVDEIRHTSATRLLHLRLNK